MKVIWPIYNLKTEYGQYPGVMSISALLKKHNINVEVIQADFEKLAHRLSEINQSILAYSTPTTYYRYYQKLNLRLKERFPNILSLFGGPHPTYFPEMIEDNGVDAVCIGEGEYAMLDLIKKLETGSPITSLNNWWVKENGQIHKNPLRPLIKNLDSLPLPDHDIFSQAMPSSVNQAVIITGRGCPYQCTYCYNHTYRKLYHGKGKTVRRRSVDNVMKELKLIKKTNCLFIRFVDDIFILSKEWLKEFTKAYKREIALPFSCMVRANYITKEIATTLKEAGCYRVLMGLEAGNDHVRNNILKRNMSKEVIIEASRMIKQAGIKLVTANIVAIPGGSFEADWETLKLNFKCKPNYASVQILRPFPKTEIYNMAKNKDILDLEKNKQLESSFSFGLRSPLKFKTKSEKTRTENLHKFFALTARFPWLTPLVRILIELPSNRFFDTIYKIFLNTGIHLHLIPPRIGLPMLFRKVKNCRTRIRT